MKRRKSSKTHKRFYKFKLLLDENFPIKKFLPRTNARFLVKHLIEDYKNKSGIEDREVYELAKKEKRLIITINTKDFKKWASESKNTGIIGVSSKIPTDQKDKKLNSLLTKSTVSELYGKLTFIKEDS